MHHLPNLLICPTCGLNQTMAEQEDGECQYQYEEGGQVAIALVDLVIAWTRILTAYQGGQHQGQACSLRAVCQANKDATIRGVAARGAVEVGTLILISHLPGPASRDTASLVQAARVGRAGAGHNTTGNKLGLSWA